MFTFPHHVLCRPRVISVSYESHLCPFPLFRKPLPLICGVFEIWGTLTSRDGSCISHAESCNNSTIRKPDWDGARLRVLEAPWKDWLEIHFLIGQDCNLKFILIKFLMLTSCPNQHPIIIPWLFVLLFVTNLLTVKVFKIREPQIKLRSYQLVV